MRSKKLKNNGKHSPPFHLSIHHCISGLERGKTASKFLRVKDMIQHLDQLNREKTIQDQSTLSVRSLLMHGITPIVMTKNRLLLSSSSSSMTDSPPLLLTPPSAGGELDGGLTGTFINPPPYPFTSSINQPQSAVTTPPLSMEMTASCSPSNIESS